MSAVKRRWTGSRRAIGVLGVVTAAAALAGCPGPSSTAQDDHQVGDGGGGGGQGDGTGPAGDGSTALPNDDGPVQPNGQHPRIWLRPADVDGYRARASASNPMYAVLTRWAEQAKSKVASCGCDNTTLDACEGYGELLGFLSLVAPDPTARADYGAHARTALMNVVQSCPASDDIVVGDRSRWTGEGFAVTTDWIYPYLSTSDKAAIRKVFLDWSQKLLNAGTTTDNHPEPVGVVNDPKLYADRAYARWAGNNYYAAHMRNLGLMAIAFDAADDPDGALKGYLANATGAWLYTIDHLMSTDTRGGLPQEGFEYGPQQLAYVAQFLYALRTAGENDVAKYGPQVRFNNPFWGAVQPALLASLSPRKVKSEDDPDIESFQPVGYGDEARYQVDDQISLQSMLGLYAQDVGDQSLLERTRWLQLNAMAAKGIDPNDVRSVAARFGQDCSYTDECRDGVLYFMLFDPMAAAPADPRPAQPLDFFAEGLGRMYSRTSWNADASIFAYNLGWIGTDHMMGEGNNFSFYRKGEWLTKNFTGYGDASTASFTTDFKNSVTVQNTPLTNDHPWLQEILDRGSQFILGTADGDGQIVARSFATGYVYASGDATALYDDTEVGAADVTHVSRSIVFLKPEDVVVYDRADTKTDGRFKRFWLHTATQPVLSGSTATVTTPGGQMLFVSAVLPPNMQLVAEATTPAASPALDEPMKYRMHDESTAATTRFLHVLQGRDAGSTAAATPAIASTAGAEYDGTVVKGTAVMFARTLGAMVSTLTYTAPPGTTAHLVTGLAPNAGYTVKTSATAAGTEVTITAGGASLADGGGVLSF